jgi:hypothetical protein
MNEGWVCPKCGSVYAPWVDKCEKCCGVSSGGVSPFPIVPGNAQPWVHVPWPGYPDTYIGDPLPGQLPSSTCGPIALCRN